MYQLKERIEIALGMHAASVLKSLIPETILFKRAFSLQQEHANTLKMWLWTAFS